MNSYLTRREFLKLSAAFAALPLVNAKPVSNLKHLAADQSRPNVVIFLFDAMSAFNLSLYGYSRETTPNISRFAEKATVYHAHRSAANFTTPSTASLFTSTYPWTHRAYSLSGLIRPEVQPNNLFRLLNGAYHQVAFSQNTFADMLLFQFDEHLSNHQDLDSFSIVGHTFYNNLFARDAIFGHKSFDQFLFKREEAHGSLFLSILNDLGTLLKNRIVSERLSAIYPQGLPRLANTDVYFLNQQVMEGVEGLLTGLPSPSFVYLHFMPPHEPYMPTREFLGAFDDGWSPQPKKRHRLASGVPQKRLNERRQTYDEYIANIDADFGRLIDTLENTGFLKNSYIIVTSDHGELFERGIHGHSMPLVFEPVIRIPLIIRAPGQVDRGDIYTNTSNVDLAPTLLKIAGQPIPDWCEGQALPGLGGKELPDRSIFVVEAKKNPAYGPLSKATLALIKGTYKLVHYIGYLHYNDDYELYDLENDPEELHNLYPVHPVAKELQAELDGKLDEINKPYMEGI